MLFPMIPLFIVISAPSGAGKTTLCDMLLQDYPEMCYSVSCTTREPRGDEVDGEDYHFLTVEAFQRFIDEGRFLEHAKVHGHYYGTLREPICQALRENQCALLDIDVAGAEQIRNHVAMLPPGDLLRAGFVDIFIAPPSIQELEVRLYGRGTDADAVIAKRLRNARQEMEQASRYMFQIVNDDLGVAFRRLCDIINVKAQLI
ncbi:MAG: guanylate kinase [Kiritimatiellaeota bacterium]|nr:guanylate kinase [Kiritimatiellota bacterium]